MTTVDYHSALLSRDRSLVPAPGLIDSRTEQDRLRFLARFAELINFYGEDNVHRGNWSPLLLKDPVFLLAAIATVKLAQPKALFDLSCRRAETLAAANRATAETAACMGHLFNQIEGLFIKTERWSYFMQASSTAYPLKTYFFHQIKEIYAPLFWAILGLRAYIAQLGFKYNLSPPDYARFEHYDPILWKTNKDNQPFWRVLGLANPKEGHNLQDIFTALKAAGNDFFAFLDAVASQAATEYENVKAKPGEFPDTLLLRAFTDLLSVHQEQLNGFAGKHLQFYYRDILKQVPRAGTPDTVYACPELSAKNETCLLLAGTLFAAGTDSAKTPVTFATTSNTTLNPAGVANAYTILLTQSTVIPNAYATAVQKIPAPGLVKKSETGQPVGWKLFGEPAVPDGAKPEIPVKTALVIASPMLLLESGRRFIRVTMLCHELNMSIVNAASILISTATGWLPLPISEIWSVTGGVELEIALHHNMPATAAYPGNPEQIVSRWPMLQIAFDEGAAPFTNFEITDINIHVHVSDMKTLQLYNDYGGLNSNSVFQPFGPVPLLNSNFFIGSREIWSKPLESLYFFLSWANLPAEKSMCGCMDEFATYYTAYNNLLQQPILIDQQPKISFFRRLFRCRKKRQQTAEITPADSSFQFNNESFTVDFELLAGKKWRKFPMYREGFPDLLTVDNQLFDVDPFFGLLAPYTLFAYQNNGDGVAPDPELQLSPLKFTGDGDGGFVRVTLQGSPYGFGSALYPKVVSATAYNNAQAIYQIYNKEHLTAVYEPPANQPFAPLASDISAGYKADTTAGPSPVQCYYHSPLGNEPVYDNTSAGAVADDKKILSPALMPFRLDTGKSSYSALFLEIEGLVPGEPLSIYFELDTKTSPTGTAASPVNFFCLNQGQWLSLEVEADSTMNLACTGIITLTVPAGIQPENLFNITGKCWFLAIPAGEYASFPDVLCLKTNGILLSRVSAQQGNTVPLPAGTIQKPVKPIPAIAIVTQPFPSFGGRTAENVMQTNQRISNRAASKDRAITHGDFYRLIRQEFNNIYDARVVFDTTTAVTNIYVARQISGPTAASAFAPLFSSADLSAISLFLAGKLPGTGLPAVRNFIQVPVIVTAIISLATGYTPAGVIAAVTNAINLYLSPWILADVPQLKPGEQPASEGLAALIDSVSGVAFVREVVLPVPDSTIVRQGPVLYVPAAKHNIQCYG